VGIPNENGYDDIHAFLRSQSVVFKIFFPQSYKNSHSIKSRVNQDGPPINFKFGCRGFPIYDRLIINAE
jgi:hypothetical protein